MQFFSDSLAKVRTVKHTNWVTFDPPMTKKPAMEKIITNPWYVKKCITLLIFIALIVTVTILKRISVTEVIHVHHFRPDLAIKVK